MLFCVDAQGLVIRDMCLSLLKGLLSPDFGLHVWTMIVLGARSRANQAPRTLVLLRSRSLALAGSMKTFIRERFHEG